jgi:hypothetical protein
MRMPAQPARDNECVIRHVSEALNAGDREAGKQLAAADIELDTRVT